MLEATASVVSNTKVLEEFMKPAIYPLTQYLSGYSSLALVSEGSIAITSATVKGLESEPSPSRTTGSSTTPPPLIETSSLYAPIWGTSL